MVRVFVFVNGEMADPAWIAHQVRPDDLVVAVDGGTRHALAAGLTPHHVIGDLDSMTETERAWLEEAETYFHAYPTAKDETDLELALLWAAAQPRVTEIVIVGAWGGRPDQAVANLLLLAHPALRGKAVRLMAGRWEVSLVRGGETLVIRGRVGDRLSLIPMGGAVEGVRTTGLTYALDGETLAFGPARGVSNVLAAETATVYVLRGQLWCFHERAERTT